MEEKAELLGEEGVRRGRVHSWLLSTLLLLLTATSCLLTLHLLPHLLPQPTPHPSCLSTCSVELVESTPEGLVFNSSLVHLSTHAAWTRLLALAEADIHLAGMYFSLRGQDVFPSPSAAAGEHIFQQLEEAVGQRGIKLKIAENAAKPGASPETAALAAAGAEVRGVNFTALVGAGVLHTKLWVVDGRHFYVGSANFDWRSLTQVKEVGALVTDCPCLAEDIDKIWAVYWALGGAAALPPSWPPQLATAFNADTPLVLPGLPEVHLASSPAALCPAGREVDLDAIVKAIDAAEEVVEVSVMDYIPATLYTHPMHFWPDIDQALRRAAIDRGVTVRLLASHWAHTRPAIARFLRSLQDLAGTNPRVDIEVRLFTVPSFTPEQAKIPFARVNHNKYMVTEKQGYIGTSNWSGDYFLSTGGVGLVFTGPLRDQLAGLFARDWTSSYASPLPPAAGGEGEDHSLLYNHYEL